MYISSNLNMLANIIKKAGMGLSRDFSEIEQLQSSVKGHEEFTKAAIDRTETVLRRELQKLRAQYPVISKGEKAPKENHYLISPMDGAVNFMHGIPYFSISIAEFCKERPVAAVICNPATSEIYFAEQGNGAFKEGTRNYERLRVSSRRELKSAMVAVDEKTTLSEVITRTYGATSLDLAYVASGKLEGVVSVENDVTALAAGILILKEAGGRVFALNQKDTRESDINLALAEGSLVAGNAEICRKIFDLTR